MSILRAGIAAGRSPGASAFTLEGDFDGGNADMSVSSVSNAGSATPTVNLVPRDTFWPQLSTSVWSMFSFRLTGANGKQPTIRIDTTDFYDDYGTSPAWRPWYSYDNVIWTRWDSDPTQDGATVFWEFQLGTAFTQDTVYIAQTPRFPVGRATELINWFDTNHSNLIQDTTSGGANRIVTNLTSQTDEQGRTIPSQPLYSFEVSDPSASPTKNGTKQTCIIMMGQHPSETMGDLLAERFLKFLTEGSAEATNLLANFRFYVYPCVNPMGRYGGAARTQWDPVEGSSIDMNRDWVNQALESTQEVVSAITSDMGTDDAVFFLDTHTTRVEKDQPDFFFWHDDNMTTAYLTNFEANIDAYTNYDFNSSSLTTDARTWVRSNFVSEHAYVLEMKEYAEILAGDIDTGGEHVAKALSDALDDEPTQFGFSAPVTDFTPVNVGTATETSGGSTIAVSAGVSVPAGSTLFVSCAIRNPGTETLNPSASDDSGNTWSREIWGVPDGAAPVGTEITQLVFFKANVTTGLSVSDQITLSGLPTASENAKAVTAFYIDADLTQDATPVFSGSVEQSGGSDAFPTSGNITTTADAVVLLGSLCVSHNVSNNNKTVTEDPNFNTNVTGVTTDAPTTGGGDDRRIHVGDRLEQGAETIAYTPTLNDVAFWVCGLAAYKETV